MRFVKNVNLYENNINNKTYKLFLLELCKFFNIPNYVAEYEYVVHHLDGDDSNNSVNNVSLMRRTGKGVSHSSFHTYCRNHGYINGSVEYWNVFNSQYLQHTVMVGKYIAQLNQIKYEDGEVLD